MVQRVQGVWTAKESLIHQGDSSFFQRFLFKLQNHLTFIQTQKGRGEFGQSEGEKYK